MGKDATYDLKGNELTDAQIAAAHQRWYKAQPMTHCRRCNREFPNSTGDKVEYCSFECEIGWIVPAPLDQPERNHRRRLSWKRHLPIGSFRSNWS